MIIAPRFSQRGEVENGILITVDPDYPNAWRRTAKIFSLPDASAQASRFRTLCFGLGLFRAQCGRNSRRSL
jgi:hypothetical protein